MNNLSIQETIMQFDSEIALHEKSIEELKAEIRKLKNKKRKLETLRKKADEILNDQSQIKYPGTSERD